jgi:hypothetical protein
MEGNAKSLHLKSSMQKELAAAVHPFKDPFHPRFLYWDGQTLMSILNMSYKE